MTVPAHDMLSRMADTLRTQVGPAVGDPFAKTQAFMAAVILTKLAGQLRTADSDARAAAEERREVAARLRDGLDAVASGRVVEALGSFDGDAGDAGWNRLVAALYADRDLLGPHKFDELLGVVRTALRARLDRALAYAA